MLRLKVTRPGRALVFGLDNRKTNHEARNMTVKNSVVRLRNSSAFASVKCGEGKVPAEVQVLRVGKFKHPVYGDFEITAQVLAEMKSNFDNNVRGIDLAFDYYHASDEDASGWVKDLQLREGGQELWAMVDWTPKAQQKLADRELRYFSPDFAFQWQDPETGANFQNVLFGGGLTNRPFVKEMQAIVANEPGGSLDKKKEIECGGPGSGPQGGGSGKQSPERRTALRQAALQKNRDKQNASAKQSAAIKKGQAAKKEADKANSWAANTRDAKKNANNKLNETKEGEFKMDEKDKKIAELEAKIAELEAALGADEHEKQMAAQKEGAVKAEELAKTEEENKKLLSENAALKEKAEKAETTLKLAEKNSEFNVLLSEGKACVAQKDAFIKGDMTEFIKLAQPLNLKAKGSSETGEQSQSDDIKAILKLAEEKQKANPSLTRGDAISVAKKELKK